MGFPGETDLSREKMIDYVISNKNIHTITITTFDLTRGAPMEQNFDDKNPYLLEMRPAKGFQVRLPYSVNGENWKARIVPWAHKMMLEVIKKRPDIGFMTLFPDQIRSFYCDKFTNQWGKIFLNLSKKERYTNEIAITTAEPLDDTTQHFLSQTLNCNLKITVDSSIIGGMRLRQGNKIFDNSISYQLNHLKKTLYNL